MRATIRVLVVAVLALVGAGGVLLYTLIQEPPADSPPEAVQLFPAAERWPGVIWRPIDEDVFNVPGASVQGVSSHGSWIAAWGEAPLPDPADGTMAVVWTSRGGVGWEQHELQLVSGERIHPQNLAVGPAGYLVYALRNPEDQIGLVAVSKDAEHWVEVGRPPIDLGGPLAATATGFVTVGVKAGEPMILTTSDGAAWEQVTVPDQGGLSQLSDVRRTNDGFVVAGRVERAGDWEGVIWRSRPGGLDDLGANSVLIGPGDVFIERTVPFAGGIFALGSAGEVGECALLGGRLASLGPITADTCSPPRAAWALPSGNPWQQVAWPQLLGGLDRMPTIHAITAGAAGVVAVVDETPVGAQQSFLGLWTSRDGVEWARVGNGMPIGPWGLSGAVVGLPGRLIVFGYTGSGIAAWMGTPDG